MPIVNVQFADSTDTTIVSYFACPQDPAVWPNQAAIDSADPRYLAFLNPPPTPATIAAAALSAGLAVTSTSTPAVNGTYALDPVTQSKIAAMVLTIQVNGTFPNSMTAYPWPLLNGAFVTFPNVTVFKDWATALSNYVAVLDLYAAGAPGVALPSASTTIA
jgi:hypothetical protein